MAEDSSSGSSRGSHEGLPRTLKRLANGPLVMLGELITHQADTSDYRNH